MHYASCPSHSVCYTSREYVIFMAILQTLFPKPDTKHRFATACSICKELDHWVRMLHALKRKAVKKTCKEKYSLPARQYFCFELYFLKYNFMQSKIKLKQVRSICFALFIADHPSFPNTHMLFSYFPSFPKVDVLKLWFASCVWLTIS